MRVVWQQAGTTALRLTWVRRLLGHKASACRAYWDPVNDGLAIVSGCWEALLLFWSFSGQESEHTPVMGFDWLLWLVTGVLGPGDKLFGSIFEQLGLLLSVLCVRCMSSKLLLQTAKPLNVRWILPPLSYCRHHYDGITACNAAWVSFVLILYPHRINWINLLCDLSRLGSVSKRDGEHPQQP